MMTASVHQVALCALSSNAALKGAHIARIAYLTRMGTTAL